MYSFSRRYIIRSEHLSMQCYVSFNLSRTSGNPLTDILPHWNYMGLLATQKSVARDQWFKNHSLDKCHSNLLVAKGKFDNNSQYLKVLDELLIFVNWVWILNELKFQCMSKWDNLTSRNQKGLLQLCKKKAETEAWMVQGNATLSNLKKSKSWKYLGFQTMYQWMGYHSECFCI